MLEVCVRGRLSHSPRTVTIREAVLEAEGQEKASGSVKGWPAKQHGNEQFAWYEGHIPVKPILKLQSHFINFLRFCDEPVAAVTCTQGHMHCA